jgi:hypothetical protein
VKQFAEEAIEADDATLALVVYEWSERDGSHRLLRSLSREILSYSLLRKRGSAKDPSAAGPVRARAWDYMMGTMAAGAEQAAVPSAGVGSQGTRVLQGSRLALVEPSGQAWATAEQWSEWRAEALRTIELFRASVSQADEEFRRRYAQKLDLIHSHVAGNARLGMVGWEYLENDKVFAFSDGREALSLPRPRKELEWLRRVSVSVAGERREIRPLPWRETEAHVVTWAVHVEKARRMAGKTAATTVVSVTPLRVHFKHNEPKPGSTGTDVLERPSDAERFAMELEAARSAGAGFRLVVYGYADSSGTTPDNLSLSKRRAEWVIQTLKGLRVPEAQGAAAEGCGDCNALKNLRVRAKDPDYRVAVVSVLPR